MDGELRPTGETKPQNELILFCWLATNSFWYVSLLANCRAGSRHRPFCNNSIGEEFAAAAEAADGGNDDAASVQLPIQMLSP